MITEDQVKAMMDEYKKGGKFAEYVDKACDAYSDTVPEELRKVTIYEYYKSVVDGCNKEKD